MKNLKDLLAQITIDFFMLDKSTQVAIKLTLGSVLLAFVSYVVQWLGFNIFGLSDYALKITSLGVTRFTQSLLLVNYLYCVLAYAIFFYSVLRSEEAKYQKIKQKYK